MINRKEFRAYWRKTNPFLASIKSPVWLPEQTTNARPSRYFVKTHKQVACNSIEERQEFWLWCTKNCAGQILCYSSSDEDGDWWGFTHKADIALWLLKWV